MIPELTRRILHTLCAFCLVSSVNAQAAWRGGFYTDGMGQAISDVPWTKLTHLYLCCAAPTTAAPFLSQNWLTPANYPTLISAAHANNVKVILSIIDLAGASYPTATAVGSVDTFVTSIVDYVNSNGFDGVDLDWENSVNISQYIAFVGKLRAALPTKLITMDVGDWGGLPSVAASAHPNLDKINVMCYDMASYSGVSWYNDAIHNNGNGSLASCEARVGAFTNPSVGVPSSQIIVGIPAYGYVWNGATAAGISGATFNSTQYPYNQIVSNTAWWNGGANKHWDGVYGADYLSVTSANQFVTYNDADSVPYIVNWGNSQGYGGYYVLFLYQEYMSGLSGDSRYPLTAALYSALSGTSSGSLPAISTASPLPPAIVGSPYSLTLNASGSTPISWSVSNGALPTGLSLNSGSGQITGVPTSMGNSAFTVVATNSAGGGSRQFGLLSVSQCDLNSDGIINTADVTIAINAVLGNTLACRDLAGTGQCDVTDVQRVINAYRGGTCRVGP